MKQYKPLPALLLSGDVLIAYLVHFFVNFLIVAEGTADGLRITPSCSHISASTMVLRSVVEKLVTLVQFGVWRII